MGYRNRVNVLTNHKVLMPSQPLSQVNITGIYLNFSCELGWTKSCANIFSYRVKVSKETVVLRRWG